MALGRWGHRDHAKEYIWGDEMMMFIVGDEHQYLQSWASKDYIYFFLGIEESKHWVVVEVCLGSWEMVIYDSDHFVNLDAVLKK